MDGPGIRLPVTDRGFGTFHTQPPCQNVAARKLQGLKKTQNPHKSIQYNDLWNLEIQERGVFMPKEVPA